MARAITYSPPVPSTDPVAEQSADLMAALHQTGLLRALTGAVRAYPDLAARLVDGLDAEKLKALVALGGAADVLGADGAERLVAGLRSALAAADHAISRRPPSLVAIVRQLGDPDLRRGVSALLAAVAAFGRSSAIRP